MSPICTRVPQLCRDAPCAAPPTATTYQLARPALLGGDLLELQADLLADHLAPRKDGDVLQRRLAVVSESGSLNRAHLPNTTNTTQADSANAKRQQGGSRATAGR